MTRDELTELVLTEVHRRCKAVRSRPRPPAWKRWEVEELQFDLKYGPRYTPKWFGELAATEAGRVRLLRTLYRLADAGLLIVVKSHWGGRLARVRITPAGSRAVAELSRTPPAGAGDEIAMGSTVGMGPQP
jgi:hypothetical protein